MCNLNIFNIKVKCNIMKSKHSEWFEVGVKYDKIGDSGAVISVKESYTIEAFSFADAEESIAEELKVYISGEFEVSDIKKAQYKEIFFSENPKLLYYIHRLLLIIKYNPPLL